MFLCTEGEGREIRQGMWRWKEGRLDKACGGGKEGDVEEDQEEVDRDKN